MDDKNKNQIPIPAKSSLSNKTTDDVIEKAPSPTDKKKPIGPIWLIVWSVTFLILGPALNYYYISIGWSGDENFFSRYVIVTIFIVLLSWQIKRGKYWALMTLTVLVSLLILVTLRNTGEYNQLPPLTKVIREPPPNYLFLAIPYAFVLLYIWTKERSFFKN